MNILAMKLVVVAALLFETGCVAFMFSFPSPFFSSFSLSELVERNKSQSGLNCSSGGSGIGGGGGRFGMKQSRSTKSEGYSCQIAGDEEKFDEEHLLQILKQTVESDLNESKAKIVNTGSPEASSFYFEYSIDDIKGRVEVSGQKHSGKFYSLNAILDETKGEAK
jgi:hypothetical protein